MAYPKTSVQESTTAITNIQSLSLQHKNQLIAQFRALPESERGECIHATKQRYPDFQAYSKKDQGHLLLSTYQEQAEPNLRAVSQSTPSLPGLIQSGLKNLFSFIGIEGKAIAKTVQVFNDPESTGFDKAKAVGRDIIDGLVSIGGAVLGGFLGASGGPLGIFAGVVAGLGLGTKVGDTLSNYFDDFIDKLVPELETDLAEQTSVRTREYMVSEQALPIRQSRPYANIGKSPNPTPYIAGESQEESSAAELTPQVSRPTVSQLKM